MFSSLKFIKKFKKKNYFSEDKYSLLDFFFSIPWFCCQIFGIWHLTLIWLEQLKNTNQSIYVDEIFADDFFIHIHT